MVPPADVDYMKMLKNFILLLLIPSAGCALTARNRGAHFHLGNKRVTIDSATGWSTRTEYAITVTGPDSAAPYLLAVHFDQGVSLVAGKKADKFDGTIVVQGGKGNVVFNLYASKCSEYLSIASCRISKRSRIAAFTAA